MNTVVIYCHIRDCLCRLRYLQSCLQFFIISHTKTEHSKDRYFSPEPTVRAGNTHENLEVIKPARGMQLSKLKEPDPHWCNSYGLLI